MPRKTKTPPAKKSRQPAATPPAKGRPRLYSEAEVKLALRRAGGNFSEAALYLSQTHGRAICRQTIARYVQNSSDLRALLVQLEQVQGDFLEGQLWKQIEANNPQAVHFALSTKFKHRGYVKTTEVTGPNGGPVQVAQPFDLSGLSDKELAVLGRILDKASAGEPAA